MQKSHRTDLCRRFPAAPHGTIHPVPQLIINGQPVQCAPLPAEISAQLCEPERERRLFATEELSTHPHAVMAMPGVPAKRNFGKTIG
jgi:hypothetical protein